MRESSHKSAIIFMILTILTLASGYALAEESCLMCHSAQAEAISSSTHPEVGCTSCHLGNPDGAGMAESHQGLVVKADALDQLDATCGQSGCHTELSANYKTSLHATVQGLKHGAIEMLGEERGTFVGENRCGTCHATCSDCHLKLDTEGTKISHSFNTDPASQNCKLCHDQTGTGYVGYEGEFEPSVHAQMGMTCADCHNGEQVHGTGAVEQHMAEVVDNKCVDCHQPATAESTNVAHKLHQDTLECSACHVDWYYNCYGCHGYDENGDALGYDKFNTNRYLAKRKDNGKIGAVVHIPMSQEVGGPDYVNGAWVFKDRHSVQKAALGCQDCHLNASIFVMDQYREAPFLGAIDGEFVPKEKVQNELLIFRSHSKLMGKTPRPGQTPDSECLKCHQ